MHVVAVQCIYVLEFSVLRRQLLGASDYLSILTFLACLVFLLCSCELVAAKTGCR